MADTKVFLSGNRIQGRSDDSVPGEIPKTSWKELDRTTLGSAGDTLAVSSFAAKDNLMVLLFINGSSDPYCNITFNGDTGSNYARRYSDNGGSWTASASQSNIEFGSGTTISNDGFGVINIRNTAAEEKLLHMQTVDEVDQGEGTAPTRQKVVAKWANTANQITTITVTNTRSGHDLGSGSEMVVLGCDDDEADSGTDNFWQELKDTELGSASGTFDSGTFTAKKYLWVEGTTNPTTKTRVEFNADQDNYAFAYSADGSADNPTTAGENWFVYTNNTSEMNFKRMFIYNPSDTQKLGIWYSSDTNNPPARREGCGKWATNTQITSVQFVRQSQGGDVGAGSVMRVWGAN